MHIISKLVPNWTWATFENAFNPARCDIIGCNDHFGAQVPVVAPNSQAGKGYPSCEKSSALAALISAAHWDAAFTNYCLKGSQVDFIDSTGLAMRLWKLRHRERFCQSFFLHDVPWTRGLGSERQSQQQRGV